jgi:hypothetical protein
MNLHQPDISTAESDCQDVNLLTMVIALIKLVAHAEIIDVKMMTMIIISVVMGGMIMDLSSRDRIIHDHLENIQKKRTNIETGDREFGA